MLEALRREVTAGALGGLASPREQLVRLARIGLACAAAALALWILFVAGTAAALAISSSDRIAASLRQAVANGTLTRAPYPVSPFEDMGHSYDMYTECVALGLNLGNEEDGLFRRVAATPFVVPDPSIPMRELAPCGYLVDALAAGDVQADYGYLRFWHGYQAYLQPLLTATSYENARRITAILLYAAMIFFAYRAGLWFGPWAWPAALLPFFIIGDFFTMPIVTSHAVPTMWIFFSAGMALVLLDHRKALPDWALPAFVFAAGAVTNYLSFLINPPLAPTLIAFLVVASAVRERRALTPAVAAAAGLGALWFAGYFAGWIEKWLFAVMVLGPEAVLAEMQGASSFYDAAGRLVLEGSGAAAGRTFEIDSVFEATWHNIAQDLERSSHTKLIPFTLLTWAIAGGVLAWAWRSRRPTGAELASFLLMLSPLLAVILWVEAARVHSSVHAGFVYRSFLLFSVVPVLAALLVARQTRDAAEAPH